MFLKAALRKRHLMKDPTDLKKFSLDFKRCQSKVYLRSDTLFLQHHVQKRLSQLEELNDEQREKLEKQSYINRQTDFLTRSLIRHSLVPLRCVLSQIGRENVELKGLPKYVDILVDVLHNDPYVRQLYLSYNNLDDIGCQRLTRLLWTNKHITTLILHKCGMKGHILEDFVRFGTFDHMVNIGLSGNEINGSDCHQLCILLKKCRNLKVLSLKSNQLETMGCRKLGTEIGRHLTLQNLDISWNHIRRHGAIDIAAGIKKSSSLVSINLSWNGLAYEGCSALSEAIANNSTVKLLNLSCNRIHPPALLDLLKGLTRNSTLRYLDVSYNPITPAFTSIFLEELCRCKTSGLKELIMKRIVVDQKFLEILTNIQNEREFKVIFERSLPLHIRPKRLEIEIQAPSVFNMDPLKLLYLLKEKNRAQDFFNKINKDDNDVLTIDEIQALFREMGVSVTRSVVEKIMEFMDTDQSGAIDLGEFMEGDRRIRKMSRDYARSVQQKEQQAYNKHSRSFTRGHIDPMTFQLKIQKPKELLPPIKSRESSISPSPR